MKCRTCRRKFPDHLVIGDVCALCALASRNRIHGLPIAAPFTGEMAAMMFDETRDHYRKTNQPLTKDEEETP